MTDPYCVPFTLYELDIDSLTLNLSSGPSLDVSATLSNGRASYILFQHLVARLSGLRENSEGGSSDLIDDEGRGYEVKSYRDPELWPRPAFDLFHTSASSTFGPNNHGPRIKQLLDLGDYAQALEMCRLSGFDKNDFYIYTNTSGYAASIPFRYFVIPTETVLASLSKIDPRKISRTALLDMLASTVRL
ncbi:hypothetical protein [Blastococcus capsensis]|uniref:hypothetical protein n=1 Tax=Blastococcus capsensis TaxID=1564163 RepID=UPI002540C7CB|nr:hypothetical protein [Blastococcus capsensis]MDK3255605.1 hypothetical protein [Blastococcus capsensis]